MRDSKLHLTVNLLILTVDYGLFLNLPFEARKKALFAVFFRAYHYFYLLDFDFLPILFQINYAMIYCILEGGLTNCYIPSIIMVSNDTIRVILWKSPALSHGLRLVPIWHGSNMH